MTATNAESEDVVRELSDALDEGDFETVEELLADDSSGPSKIFVGEKMFREPFSDYGEELVEVTTDGNTVTAQYDVSGVHDGEFLSLSPTGNEFTVPLIRTFTVEDGRITSWRALTDRLAILEQVGVDLEALGEDLEEYVDQ